MGIEETGFEHFAGALGPRDLALMDAISADLPSPQPGARLVGDLRVATLCDAGGALGKIAGSLLSGVARPVRAVLFDKTPDNNWPLGWHQDRTICVRDRAEVAGFGPFTKKHGILHVQPPASVIAGMVTLRAHLDDCGAANAPLKVAPGSHLLGLIPVGAVNDIVARADIATNHARAGDVWAYRTLILHASDAAIRPVRRRVLQVDFANFDLPAPLDWLGIWKVRVATDGARITRAGRAALFGRLLSHDRTVRFAHQCGGPANGSVR